MLNFPKVRAGDALSARWLNRLIDWVHSLRIVTDGSILVDHTPGGQLLRVASGATTNIYTGTGGIDARSGAAPGKATDVLQLSWVGETLPTAGAPTITVYNVSSTAVGAGKYGIALMVGGRWEIVVESCG